MKQMMYCTFLTAICIFTSFSAYAQEEVIFDNIVTTGLMVNRPTDPNIEMGNYISIAGSNRILTEISAILYIEGGATGTGVHTFNFWSSCPSTGDGDQAYLCGDSGAELYLSLDFPITYTAGSTGYYQIDFPLGTPINFSDLQSDSLYVTFKSSRPTDSFVGFSANDAIVGEFLDDRFSFCGIPVLNTCFGIFSQTIDIIHFNFSLTARPYPFTPTTVDLSNVYNQTSTAEVSVADVYIGDTNFVPTQSITLSQTTFTCADIGVNTISATVTYPNGVTDTYDVTVIVQDASPPVITLPYPNFTVTAAPGECDGSVVNTNELIYAQWDNCSIPSGSHFSGPPSGSVFPIGSTLCAHAYTDASGNQTLDYYLVTVLPNPVDADNDGISDECDMCPATQDVSLNFNGDGENYVAVQNNNTIFNFENSSYSFEAWVKPDITGNHSIVSKGNGYFFSTIFAYNIEEDGRQSLGIGGTSPFFLDLRYSDATVPVGEWSHIAVTLDKSGLNPVATFYLNGVPDVPKTFSLPTNVLYDVGTEAFFIGKRGTSLSTLSYFDGSMDELVAWSKVLTEAEIIASMSSTYTGSEADLVAYYDFNDADACVANTANTLLVDKGGSGADGDLQNFSLSASTCSSNWAPGNDQLVGVKALCKNLKFETAPQLTLISASSIDNGSFGECSPINTLKINGFDFVSVDLNSIGTQFLTLEATTFAGDQATCEAEITVVKDLCPAGDDAVDSDNGGLPDACDCSPFDALNDNIILDSDRNVGMDFDGVDDLLTIPNDPTLVPTNTSSMTFETWINPTDLNGFQTIVGSSDGFASFNLAVVLNNDKLRVWLFNGLLLQSNASIPSNEWTHIAVVYNANPSNQNMATVDIYINGTLDNSSSPGFLLANNWNHPIQIGNFNGFDWPFSGKMDDIRFWSTSRIANQIKTYKDRELYGTEDHLEAYFNFSNGTPNGDNSSLLNVEDFSENGFDASLSGFTQNGSSSNWSLVNDISFPVIARDSLAPCLTCSKSISMDFDGVDDHIIIPHDPELIPTNTNAMTFETWINPSNVTDIGMITSSGVFPSLNYFVYLFDNNIYVTGDGVGALVSNAAIPTNQWTHIAVVYDLTETKLYIDGVLDNTRTQTLSSNNLGFDISIGSQANGLPQDWNFEGNMDDTRFWSEARTALQISDNMNTELDTDEDNLLAYFSYGNGEPAGDNSSLTTVTDQSFSNRDGIINGFSKMGSSSNWVDGSPLTAGPENASLYFDGINDKIIIPNNPDLLPNFGELLTLEMWMYSERPDGGSIIMSSGNFPEFNLQLNVVDSILFVEAKNSSPLVSASKIPSFAWTHLAITCDVGTTTLYINGELDNIKSGPFGVANLGNDITFGSQLSGDIDNFQGKMDDIRIWDHLRTPEQIRDDLTHELTGEESGLIAYYNFNSGIPEEDNTAITSIEDLSPGTNDVSLSGFAKTGAISNWVSSPILFNDSDEDGRPDVCDNCVAKKLLVLDNQTLDGVYRAKQSITLGENLTISANTNVTFKTPIVAIPSNLELPVTSTITVEKDGCEE